MITTHDITAQYTTVHRETTLKKAQKKEGVKIVNIYHTKICPMFKRKLRKMSAIINLIFNNNCIIFYEGYKKESSINCVHSQRYK